MMPLMTEAMGRWDYCHWCAKEVVTPPPEIQHVA